MSETIPIQLIAKVIEKVNNTYEALLLEDPPYINQDDFENLLQYQKDFLMKGILI